MIVAMYLGKFEVEVIDKASPDTFQVRALSGRPFDSYGVGWWAPTAYATVYRGSLTDIRRVDPPEPEGDPAAIDAMLAYRETAEWLDSRDYHEQTGHAPGYYGG